MQEDKSLREEGYIPVDALRGEKCKSIEEMCMLLTTLQKMGHRLADKSHNEDYDAVNDLNQYLHQARRQLEQMRINFLNE